MLIRNLYPLFPGISPGRFNIKYQMKYLWVIVTQKKSRKTHIFNYKSFDMLCRPIILTQEKTEIAQNKGLIYQDQTLAKNNNDLANLSSSIPEFLALIDYLTKTQQ